MCASVIKQYNLVPANGRWFLEAGNVPNFCYQCCIKSWGTGIRGLMRGRQPSPKVTRRCSSVCSTSQGRSVSSQSVCGCTGEGVVVTVAWPCLLNGRLFGVAGLEVRMNDILEHVAYYHDDSSYAFVMDKRGIRFQYYWTARSASIVTVLAWTAEKPGLNPR